MSAVFDEFKEIFKTAAADYNALNPIVEENIPKDPLKDMFLDIEQKLKQLSSDYESVLCKRESDILDTLIQIMNYMMDHCAMCKYYDTYKNLSKFISDLFGKESELVKLLELLRQYIIQYKNIKIDDDETADCKYSPEDKKYIGTHIAGKKGKYKYGETILNHKQNSINITQYKSEINENCNTIDLWINEYNDFIEEYNEKFYNKLVIKNKDPFNRTTSALKIDLFADHRGNNAGILYCNLKNKNGNYTERPAKKELLDNIPETFDEIGPTMKSNMNKLKSNGIYFGDEEVYEKIKETFGYDFISNFAKLTSTEVSKNVKLWQEIEVGSRGDGTELYIDDSNKVQVNTEDTSDSDNEDIASFFTMLQSLRNIVNVINISTSDVDDDIIFFNGAGSKDNKIIPLISKRVLPYYHTDSEGRSIRTVFYDSGTDTYYKYDTSSNINKLIVAEGDEEPDLYPIYNNGNIKLYVYDGNIYKYRVSNNEFLGMIPNKGVYGASNKYSVEYIENTKNSLLQSYNDEVDNKNKNAAIIRAIEVEGNTAKRNIMIKIKEIAQKIFQYVKRYMGITESDGLMSISEPNETGEVDIKVGVDESELTEAQKKDQATMNLTKCGSRSIFARSFVNNRFIGYIGKVDKKGYVAQKSYVSMAIPITKNGKRKNKSLTLSSPNLKIINVTFKNNPKNIIFKLFNRWDYTANIQIENDGEKPNDKNKSPYITGKYYLRFGSVFPAKKDIDMNASRQQMRISEPNSSRSWSSGSIEKKGTFEISNLKIKALFQNDEAMYKDIENYKTKFADKIDITYEVARSIGAGKEKYVFSGEGLELNNDIKEEMMKENPGIYNNTSFFKGSAKLKDPNKSEDDETTTDNTSSKDIVVAITPLSGIYTLKRNYYKISVYMDPDSTMNNQIWEQNENDIMVYLPMLVSNVSVKRAYCRSVLSKTKTSDELASALLGLAAMFGGADGDNEIGSFIPFDDSLFDSLMNMIENAKMDMLSEIIELIKNIGASAQTVVLTESLYKTFDKTFCETYISDLVNEYVNVKSKTDVFVSEIQDIDSLSNNTTFGTDIEQAIEHLRDMYIDFTNDIVTSEDMIHRYKKRLNVVMPQSNIQVNLGSTLSFFYNYVTGSSQSLSALSLSGGKIITTHLESEYNNWIAVYNNDVYNTANANKDVTKNTFCIEQEYLQLFYLLSVANNALKNKYNPITGILSEFYRTLLLRLLSENIQNIHMKKIFDNETIRRMNHYKDYENKFDIANLSYNTYYLNPYITDIFPQLLAADNIDIDYLPIVSYDAVEKYNVDAMRELDITNFFTPLLYKAILEDNPYTIQNKLKKLWEFLNNGQKLNIRELILKYNLMFVLEDLNVEIDNVNYHIGYQANKEEIRSVLKVISAVSEYREMIEDYTIDKLLNKEKVDETGTEFNRNIIKLLLNQPVVLSEGQ